jgi:hypothetical protein
MNKNLLQIVGFVLLILGMLSLVLSFVGLQLAFLTWLNAGGQGLGLLLKVTMVVAGFVCIYLARSDFRGE